MSLVHTFAGLITGIVILLAHKTEDPGVFLLGFKLSGKVIITINV
jgi:hypothetical protein